MLRPAKKFILCGLLLFTNAWAGREFTIGAGENAIPDELLVRVQIGASLASILNALSPATKIQTVHPGLNIFRVVLPTGTLRILSPLLAASPLVEYVEPNRIRHLTVNAPNDPNYGPQQYNLPLIKALEAWTVMPNRYLTSATAGTARVKVAMLDTGVDCTHPDFMNMGASSTNSALGGQLLWSSSQAIVPTTLPSPTCPWQDDHGHGTHTAGIVAAVANNGAGVASLGYPLQLVVLRVVTSPEVIADADIVQGITAAVDAGASVISMSFGGVGYSQAVQDAVNYAWQRNVVVVAAAGNNSASQLFFPASAHHVLGISATDSTNVKASFSNFGPSIDLAAPGVLIYSTVPTYSNTTLGQMFGYVNYTWLSGTSMAAPQISALAGLLATSTPGVAAETISQRMQQTAASTNMNGGWDQNVGYGVIDAFRALSGSLRTASVGGATGQVLDTAMVPISGVTVAAGAVNVITDSSGLFRLSSLAAGVSTLTASKPGLTTQNRTVGIAAGADTSVTIVMGQTTGTFSGTVTRGGSPVPGAVVEALSGGLIQANAVAGVNGAYTLPVPPGTYDIRASAISAVQSTLLAQSVTSGATVTANLTVLSFGTITGLITNPSGNPLANVQVNIVGPGFTAGATTAANGVYSSIGLPAGSYSVTAVSGALMSTAPNIPVSNGAASTVNLVVGNVAPATVSVTPNSGSGGTQTFSFVYSDVNGAANLARSYGLVNAGLDSNNACYFFYDQPVNGIYLVSDNGATLLGPLAPGFAGTLQNNQCTINGTGSAVTLSGNTLTLAASITFKPTFVGSKSIFMNAMDTEGLFAGWLSRGTWSTGSNVAPVTVSVTPASGSGANQVFSLLYSDANGAADLSRVYVLFNYGLDIVNACYAFYDRPSNSMFLLSDNGGALLGPLAPGAAGTLQNSQCTLNGTGSSVVLSGTNLTLAASISFKPSFSGTKNIYMNASDNSGLFANWTSRGTWTPSTNTPPTTVSVTPSSGSGTTQTFSMLLRDINGAADLNLAYTLFNAGLDGTNACYLIYARQTNSMFLVSDNGASLLGPLTPGAAGSVQNSQCTLNGTGSSAVTSGNDLTFAASLNFKPAFVGTKSIYMNASDNSGALAGWTVRGTWSPQTNAAPVNVSVTPSSGSGSTQSFTIKYSDANGATDLTRAFVLINAGLDSNNACYFFYDRIPNAMYLVSDNGATLLGPLVPGGTGSVQNSQCTLNAVGSSASAAGNTLTLVAPIVFKSAFAGTKNVFLNVVDSGGLFSGWASLGTWQPF